MPQIMTYIVDVNGPLSLVITSDLMQKDRQANTIKVLVQDRRDPVDLTGWSALYTMEREDGVRVVVEGQIWDNEISVTLTDACYQVAGRYAAFIRITSPDTEEKRTVLRMAGLVVNEGNGPVIDGSGIIPSLEDLLAKIAAMEAATDAANQAAERADHAVDNLVIKPEAIQAAVDAYLEENPVETVTPEEIAEVVDNALLEAKDSGEFDGPPGKDGPQGAPGAPGVSITGVSIETGGVDAGGAVSWNDLQDKPFGEEVSYSDTLRVSITPDEVEELVNSGQLVGGMLLKVSDSVVTMDDLANGFTIDFGDSVIDVPADGVGEFAFELFEGVTILAEVFFSVGEQAVGVNLDGSVFTEKGLYIIVYAMYDTHYVSVTIPGFQFPTTVVTPIEKKFIPKHTHSAADVAGIPQADWEQADENAVDYIRNKPQNLTVRLMLTTTGDGKRLICENEEPINTERLREILNTGASIFCNETNTLDVFAPNAIQFFSKKTNYELYGVIVIRGLVDDTFNSYDNRVFFTADYYE